MAMLKICTDSYNGVDSDIVLIQGKVCKDGEIKKYNDKTLGKSSVVGCKNADGTTMFVAINGWGENAGAVGRLKKGQNILCVGRLKSREYNEKIYWDCDVDFIALSGVTIFTNSETPKPRLKEIDESKEAELPF